MRIAVPSQSSPLFHHARGAMEALWPAVIAAIEAHGPRRLYIEVDPRLEVLFCRAIDIPMLVATGTVDVGLTGYDVGLEFVLGNSEAEVSIYDWGPLEGILISLVGKPDREVRRLYTEYPSIGRALFSNETPNGFVSTIPVKGSTEGLVAFDVESAGLVVVESGITLRDNGLEVIRPIMMNRVVVVAQSSLESASIPGRYKKLVPLPAAINRVDLRTSS